MWLPFLTWIWTQNRKFLMVLLLCKKIYQSPCQPTNKINYLFFIQQLITNSLIISGIGVGVQRTMQWRLSSNHLCVCIQSLYTVWMSFCGKNLFMARDITLEMSVIIRYQHALTTASAETWAIRSTAATAETPPATA